MATESISTNPASSVVTKATESVRRPPASPEVTLIQPTQSISASGESEQAVNENQNIEIEVTKAISQIQIMMDLRNRSVSFTRDQETGTDIIKVIDDNTGLFPSTVSDHNHEQINKEQKRGEIELSGDK